MIIEDAFTVAAPIEQAWPLLNDIPRVAACIPHAELTETVDAQTYRATVTVKVGPVSVGYRATIVVASRDDLNHTATLQVQGDELRGRGGVRATIVTRAAAAGDATRVTLHTEAQISGIVASVGGRLIEGVAKRTVAEFAANLGALV